MGKFKYETPAFVQQIGRWVRNRTLKEKLCMGAIAAVVLLVLLKIFVKEHAHFFVAAQTSQAVGILLLIYKLTISKTCSGLSLRTQELTAINLFVRLLSSLTIRGQVHVVLDFLNLVATLWVMYMMRFKLKSTYLQELDNMPLLYVLVPCGVAALLAHPIGPFPLLIRWMWSFCISVEAVAVLPQLRLMQNSKMVEPFTSHYVFALGVSRFMGCANWIIQLIETRGVHLMLIGQGHIWILLALVAELVHTFILADFCYYYVKSVMEGQTIMSLRSLV
ncbi:putative ER lumen protein-retaining receptor C28H8.4 isoform X1 [Chenopodium quinoa]|uniref:putative ER lumen protein-retaining receptor C28H8.4 isoform X1 n=1 Tax=Chenopodium quinoa TaxID=63459 RepID=UPI000B7901FE|nr:putative ER lumen protein-retaining receptor C28H8.4 isoform X1 [Chenopodium quinoa]